jgi:hypothetical protein
MLFDVRSGLQFKFEARSRPATDELVAHAIVERLQRANWISRRGTPTPLGSTPGA